MVIKVDIGSISSIEAESVEGKEQLVETSYQDVASGECDGRNTAHVSSTNTMDLPKDTKNNPNIRESYVNVLIKESTKKHLICP